jgi:hypothetical protein
MKEIIHTTHYWLFRKVYEDSKSFYYFVRALSSGSDKPSWHIGYENHMGLVSIVGVPFTGEQHDDLEIEFSEEVLRGENVDLQLFTPISEEDTNKNFNGDEKPIIIDSIGVIIFPDIDKPHMHPKDTYTEEEVIKLLAEERRRARNIAYELYYEHIKLSEFYVNRESLKGLVERNTKYADIARQIGNAISGGNALTPQDETIEDRIRKEFKKI